LLRRKLRPPALGEAEIAELFAPLASAKGLLLAVSGGPDSTALLIMAALWAAAPGRPRVEVATIDHGLRPEAAAEAAAVGEQARRRGLEHHVIAWRGPKPSSRIQERARAARYRLLAERARQIGADHIVTAHHADDQSETVLFRLLRGSGLSGLRGMEKIVRRDGVSLARPLLGLAKAELVAFCKAHGEVFVEDPSNADPRFARTRLRRLTAQLGEEGLGANEIARLARRAGRMEEAVARATRAAAERLNLARSAGVYDAKALFEEPQEIALRLLAGEIARIAATEPRRIRLEQIEAIGDKLGQSLARGEAFATTLGGASLRLTSRGALSIKKAPPRRGKNGSA
jgi:tRNA(Ile)-lysidine synthase